MSNRLLRSELKEIVRECLVEILTEGVAPSSRKSLSENTRKLSRERRSAFDHVTWASENKPEREVVDHTKNARALTDNPILAEVLADSQRTMMQQIDAERKGPVVGAGDLAQRKVAAADPMDMFEGSSNWAALAFQDK